MREFNFIYPKQISFPSCEFFVQFLNPCIRELFKIIPYFLDFWKSKPYIC